MTRTASKKFNLPPTTMFIRLPLAFTGKNDKRFRGLTNAYQFLLALIYTKNDAFKAPAKLTYDDFVEKFGMSRETVSKGLRELISRKIIERVGISRYRFLIKFNKDDYIVIDDYLHKQLWDVCGKRKRLTRSQIKTLGFLERENSPNNPNTHGVFKSSQARIGVAINLPKTTAGESIRELVRAELVRVQSVGGLHSLTLYVVDAELMRVRRRQLEPTSAELEAVKKLFQDTGEPARRSELTAVSELCAGDELDAERRVENLRRELMTDASFAELWERLGKLKSERITALKSRDKALQATTDEALQALGARLRAYLNAHGAAELFPKGYFYIF